MGSLQTKCCCGKISTTEIIAINQRLNVSLDVKKTSRYKKWNTSNMGETFESYPCDDCSENIKKCLGKNKIEYMEIKSGNGFLHIDLP